MFSTKRPPGQFYYSLYDWDRTGKKVNGNMTVVSLLSFYSLLSVLVVAVWLQGRVKDNGLCITLTEFKAFKVFLSEWDGTREKIHPHVTL